MRRRYSRWGFILVILLLATTILQANNIRIDNVSVIPDQRPARGWATIQFTVSWENSWFITNGPANHDAAWIFLKWKKATSGSPWKHVYLRNSTGLFTSTVNGAPWGAIEVGNVRQGEAGYDGVANTTNPGVGLFLHRTVTESGTGNNPPITVRVRWYYGDDFDGSNLVAGGLTPEDITDIRVFGIEMVNVPSGAFYLGSGGSESYAFYTAPNPATPYLVSSAGNIPVGTRNGNLNFPSSDPANGGAPSGDIPSAFPNGFNSFYCMKYEMSMQQYADFLNSIPPAIAAGYAIPGNAGRYNLTLSGGIYSTNAPFIAATYVKTETLLGFLDWAALRPMTELEYEKSCRGNAIPVANELAWGTAGDDVQLLNVNNLNQATETSATPGANILVSNGLQSAARSGIFATANSTRISAGATYYGIMEMSGNVWERVVSVGSPSALAYTGLHGDGNPATITANWPQGAPAFNGFGFRGSSWLQGRDFARVSDRFLSCYIHPTNNDQINHWGGRGVRSK